MRPGPGLVVMALAFISGARRGSTSHQQQQQQQQQQQHQQQQHQQQHQQQKQEQTILPNQYINFNNNNNNNYDHSIYFNNYYLNNNKLGKIGYEDDDYYGDGGISALARVNPWLSACDLAQPNQPDLQGQCSAGSLPVALIDEGPGPPHCPMSCHDNNYYNNKDNTNNINNNNKTNSNNSNFNNMDNRSNVKQSQTKQEQKPHQYNLQKLQQDKTQQQQQQRIQQKFQQFQQQQHQIQHQQHEQQCLYYLGDNEESSPAQLCKMASSEIENKLRKLRLRHCCERTAFSALHTTALNAVLNGGNECIQSLNDLLDMDALATRITCEFTEILVRYDCRQVYSLIHHCEDCKEAYRRWVCSTLIPYFAEPEDIRQNTTTSNSINKTQNHSAASSNSSHHMRSSRSTISKKLIANSDNNKEGNVINEIRNNSNNSSKVNGTTEKSQFISTAITNPIVQDPLLERILKRSKRKSELRRRRRIRPCLSVCQTVEQICPYFLPGDRAPAHPTQYAGEPTFLCLDQNIEEVGEQLRKSNNGPPSCCYRYCGSPSDGICAYCDLSPDNRTTADDKDPNSSSSIINNNYSNNNNNDNHNLYSYDEYDDVPPTQITNCQNFQGTTSTSSQRCTIPYYNSSSIKKFSILLSYRYIIIWYLVNNALTINNWTKNILLTHSVRL